MSRFLRASAFLVAFLIFVAAGLFLMARLKHPGSWTKVLNLFSLALVIFPVGEVIRTKRLPPSAPEQPAEALTLAPNSTNRPDIYYIILDGYARSDVMQELFNFDNSAFLERLRHKGFFVARGSTANYCQTPLSLSSSLNLDYLDDLVKGLGSDQTALHELIARNRLAETLRPLGYSFVTFSTGFEPTDADRL